MSDFKIRQGHASIQAGDIVGAALVEGLIKAGPELLFESCASCIHMTEHPASTFCRHHNAIPPVAVVVRGCSQYEDCYEVPF